ncbi:hypothetical protein [Aliiruegeria lutimaris]|uniref:Lipid-binding SYLF domain-containing protein n=1 Tax=Aliiruegeria lutimaris TaxID=571298 RepID=A0A1G9MNW1_9RHOB|nr:hypothetical protein [Aliiruegeria lutimaris]SDL75958.1 Lipid-binding SYLF domain-containing protein [Aliiruegeria lutimaris]
MPNIRAIAIATSLALASTAADSQSFRDKLLQGAEKIQEGAGLVKEGASIAGDAVMEGAAKVTKEVDESITSTFDLLSNEDTPENTRAELDAMARATFERLLAEQPEIVDLIEKSAGVAVFDTRKLVIANLAAGAGRGVAISREQQKPIYMNMGTAGVGLSLGVGGFETQVVILFEYLDDFEEFVTHGYDATAEAGTMFGDDRTNVNVGFIDGRAIFYVTDQGWKASATAAGTKYWIDPTLN